MGHDLSAVIVGETSLALHCARSLVARGCRLDAIVSAEPAFIRWGMDAGIRVVSPDTDLVAALGQVPFDYLFSIVNPRILSPAVLALPRRAAINYHDSPLPRYAGTNATAWGILAGEREWAVTWHLVTDRIDAGAVLKQPAVPIAADDTTFALNLRCYEAAVRSFEELLEELATGVLEPRPQDARERSYFGRFQRPAAAGVLSWESSAAALAAQVRALDFGPHPNPLGRAKIRLGEHWFIVAAADPVAGSGAMPGTIAAATGSAVVVACAEGDLSITRLLTLDGDGIELLEALNLASARPGERLSGLGDVAHQLTAWDAELGRHEPFWVERLRHARPGPQLPGGVEVGGAATDRAQFELRFPAALSAMDPGVGGGADRRAVLLAAVAAYFARLNGPAMFDLAVATGLDGGPATEFSPLVAETVPLPVAVGPEDTFAELVRVIARDLSQLRAHRGYCRDLLSRQPALDSAVRDALGQQQVVIRFADDGASRVEQSGAALVIVVDVEARSLTWLADRARFSEPTIRRMLAEAELLLHGCATEPQAPLATLPLLPERERALLASWNDTDTPAATALFHQLFERQAEAHPDRVALRFDGKSLGYGELNRRANRIAHRLLALGVGPETLVGICLSRSMAQIAGMLGILKSGAAFLPMDPTFPAERLHLMCSDSGIAFVIVDTDTSDRMPTGGLQCLDVTALQAEGAMDSNPNVAIDPGNLAYVIYTSGSTGRPKGVMIEHHGLANYAMYAAGLWPDGIGPRVLQFANPTFDASVSEIAQALPHGGTLVIATREETLSWESLIRLLATERVTTATLPPALLRVNPPEALPDLAQLIVAGEACTAELVRLWGGGRQLLNGYGPTEVTIAASYGRCRPGDPRPPAIGAPVPNSTAYVVDGAGQLAPIGVPGELWVGGAGVARGYLNRPDLTAASFRPDPFRPGARVYRTGDLVRWREDGTLEFLGRVDQQVKIRGHRVELGEIEAVLAVYPGVRDVVVSAREDTPGDKRLVAYFVAEGGPPVGAGELRRFAKERLPEYMMPRAFVPLGALPLNSSGKVDRRALPAPSAVALRDEAEFTPPQSDTEAKLARIWAEVLGIERVGRDENYFDLGGDSILSMQIAARALAVGLSVSPVMMLKHPTVASAAAQLDGEHTVPEATALELPALPEELRDRLHHAGTDIDDAYPLSSTQLGMLFHSLQASGTAEYHTQVQFTLSGELDVPAFRAAWGQLLARHAVLRMAFVWEGVPAPVQVVHHAVELPWCLEDWRTRSEEDQARGLASRCAEEERKGFDLSSAPLMRVTVLRMAEGRHEVIWSFHHLLLDGWSVAVVLRELGVIYDAVCAGTASHLPPARRYRDYIARLQRRDPGAEAFWQGRLASFAAATPLTIDHRPTAETASYQDQELVLTLEESRALVSRAKSLRVTTNTVLEGAWAMLLSRYSGEHDVLFGTTVTSRPVDLSGVEGMVGLFLNTLPVRITVEGSRGVTEWLQSLQQEQAASSGYDTTPLVEIQRCSGVAPGAALFESLLVFESFPGGNPFGALRVPLSLSGLRATGRTNYPLTLVVLPGERIGLTLTHDATRIDGDAAERMLGHLRVLLAGIANTPAGCLDDLALVSPEESRALVGRWNGAVTSFPREATIAALFTEVAAAHPERMALVGDGVALSYGELDAWSNRIGWQLRELGVRPGALVGLAMPRSAALIASILGIAKAGAAYVPLDSDYPVERLASMLEDISAPLVLAERTLIDRLPVRPGTRTICFEDVAAAVAAQPDGPLPNSGTGESAAYVMFTSGSTGRPKGVVVPHRAITRLVRNTDFMHFGAEEVFLLLAPVSFDASTLEIWGALLNGGLLALAPPGSAAVEQLGALIREHGVTSIWLTAALFQQVVESNLEALRPLRQLLAGGDVLPVTQVRRVLTELPHLRLINGYGPTENTTFTCCHTVTAADLHEGAIPIGRPIANTTVYVLDEKMRPVPIGVPGELYAGGAGVALGYLRREDLTAERFVASPFVPGERLYRTGDRVRRRADGVIEFLGRQDSQVKIRGFRIELGEVESAIADLPAVREAVVVAREDQPGIKRLVAYYVASAPGEPSSTELRAHCRRRLPDYMVPSAFVRIDAIPVTSNGKVNRRALPVPPTLIETTARGHVAPRTERERVLADIWSRVLRVEQVGVEDNFFELGGDSILAIQIASRAREAGLPLSIGLLLKHPTIAEQATLLNAMPAESPSTAPTGPVAGTAPLTPIEEWFFELDPAERNHWNQTFLFHSPAGLDEEALRQAVGALVEHHDVLRLRFSREGERWRQTFAPVDGEVPFGVEELSHLDAKEVGPAITRVTDRVARSLDIEAGPLLRVELLHLGAERGDRVSIAIHHLAVDGVSWRILREDLETAYRQVKAGEPITLPARTSSYQQWADALMEHAGSSVLAAERAYWLAAAEGARMRLPVDGDGTRPNLVGESQVVVCTLDESETADLLQRVPPVFATQMNDVLLTALADSLTPWTGAGAVLLDLEGHGREDLAARLDTTRTVGWFTSVFPVRVDIGGPIDLLTRLKQIKERLRGIPRRGVGYGVLKYIAKDEGIRAQPQPEIVLNYLGQFDQVTGDSTLLQFAVEDAGPWASPKGRRRHLLEVGAMVVNGRLEIRWTFNRQLHHEETVRRLADGMVDALRTLIRECLAEGAGGRTPSDFPLVALDQSQIDALVGSGKEVEDLLPLAPMQALFLTASAGAADHGFEQWTFALHGEVDAAALQAAWKLVASRHAIFRTGFRSADGMEPIQVVHRSAELPFRVHDWRQQSEIAQSASLERLLAEDRATGFDVGQPPLMRLTLVRLAERRWLLIWSNHHLLLERWSVPIVLEEVRDAYLALHRGEAPHLKPAVPWRRYLAWLAGRDRPATEAFWRGQLQGVDPAPVGRFAGHGEADGEVGIEFSVEETEALRRVAREHRVTVNSLISTAWALWLARATGRSDVVFGLAVAGRPEEVPGIADIVGMCLNNIPMRLQCDPAATVASMVHCWTGMQQTAAHHEHASLIDLQRWSGLPWHRRLFDTLVVFQHHEADERVAAWLGPEVTIERIPGRTRTNYPLALVVGGDERLSLRLAYQGRVAGKTDATAILGAVRQLLQGMPQLMDGSIAGALHAIDLPATTPASEPEQGTITPPRNATEWVVAHLWSEVLARELVDVEANFFDLGGQSLVATQITSRVRDSLGVEVPVATLFQHPTVASFAAALVARESVAGQVDRTARIVRKVEEMTAQELGVTNDHG